MGYGMVRELNKLPWSHDSGSASSLVTRIGLSTQENINLFLDPVFGVWSICASALLISTNTKLFQHFRKKKTCVLPSFDHESRRI